MFEYIMYLLTIFVFISVAVLSGYCLVILSVLLDSWFKTEFFTTLIMDIVDGIGKIIMYIASILFVIFAGPFLLLMVLTSGRKTTFPKKEDK